MFPPKKSAKPSGLDSPMPIGGKPPLATPMDDGAPDSDDMGGGAKPSPQSLNYHQGPQPCETCEYMEDSGNCQILGIQVQPQDGCNAYESKDESGEQGEDQGGGPGGPPAPPPGLYGGQ